MSARVVHIETARPRVAAAKKMRRGPDEATMAQTYMRLVYLHGCVDRGERTCN
jgi:hypothetical protein